MKVVLEQTNKFITEVSRIIQLSDQKYSVQYKELEKEFNQMKSHSAHKLLLKDRQFVNIL